MALPLPTIVKDPEVQQVLDWIALHIPDGASAGGGLPLHATRHEPGGSDQMAVDDAPSVGSLRTLGTGANQALPGDTVVAGGGDFVSQAKWYSD